MVLLGVDIWFHLHWVGILLFGYGCLSLTDYKPEEQCFAFSLGFTLGFRVQALTSLSSEVLDGALGSDAKQSKMDAVVGSVKGGGSRTRGSLALVTVGNKSSEN